MSKKKIRFMDTSFRDGFQSCFGARVRTADFLPALKAAKEAGISYFEVAGGARFDAPMLYTQESAFDMMDQCRATVGPDVELQSLSRGLNCVCLKPQSRDIINLHAKLFKKHGISTIRNFDALNDVRNLFWSGSCIKNHGLQHEVAITMMGLPDGISDYAHTSAFYVDTLKKILAANVPFDRVALKDASGTATPKTWFDTVKEFRRLLPKHTPIHCHTHSTADMAISCYYAAIEAGADIIDLALKPVSGGTSQPDLLSMWHRLRGTDFTLDVCPEKIMQLEEVFTSIMSNYVIPAEAIAVNPNIPFSPMPGGAIGPNLQMMRDHNCLDQYPKVIKEMREVVARGGFSTSVTPVSQYYFQQAFNNVMLGQWNRIVDGYGKMVLGYLGRTPAQPDPEIVKLASEQLKLPPTDADIHDLNDSNPELGIASMTKTLATAGLPTTEENIFIISSIGDKGIDFLQGSSPLNIPYKESPANPLSSADAPPQPQPPTTTSSQPAVGIYTVAIEGKSFTVQVSSGGTASTSLINPAPSNSVRHPIRATTIGTVTKLMVKIGDKVAVGQEICKVEAMKMETSMVSDRAGSILELCVNKGDPVIRGKIIAIIG